MWGGKAGRKTPALAALFHPKNSVLKFDRSLHSFLEYHSPTPFPALVYFWIKRWKISRRVQNGWPTKCAMWTSGAWLLAHVKCLACSVVHHVCAISLFGWTTTSAFRADQSQVEVMSLSGATELLQWISQTTAGCGHLSHFFCLNSIVLNSTPVISSF